MVIAFEESGSTPIASPTSSWSFTPDAGTLAGDVFVVQVFAQDNNATITPPSGSIATPVTGSDLDFPPNGDRVSVFVWVATSDAPTTRTIGVSTAVQGTVTWVRLRGVDTSDPINDFEYLESAGGPTLSTYVVPALTTTVDGCYVLGGLSTDGGGSLPTLTGPAGWTSLFSTITPRKGAMALKGVQSSAGSSGTMTGWGSTAGGSFTGPMVAWQLALHPAAGDPEPELPTITASDLTNPADRWQGKATRLSWWDGSAWGAVLPTDQGHVIYPDVTDLNTAGPVVDDRQASRASVVFADDTLMVVRGHGSASLFSSYDATDDYSVVVEDASVPLTSSDLDAAPVTLHRSPNGYLWAACMTGGNVRVTRSTNDGATWATAQTVATIGSVTGVVGLTSTGTTVVLVATANEGAGRAVRTISQSASSYTSGSWTTETLPALASGVTSDDHLDVGTLADGRVLAVAKTTDPTALDPLIYTLTRSTSGTWTAATVELGPDEDPRYTRPALAIEPAAVRVMYGRIESPAVHPLYTRVGGPGAWGSRSTLIADGNRADSGVAPAAEHIAAALGDYPVLSHDRATGDIGIAWVTPAAAPTLTRTMLGATSATGFAASCQSSGERVRLKVGTNSAVTTGVTRSGWVTPDGTGYAHASITGLTAGTNHWYLWELEDVATVAHASSIYGPVHMPDPDDFTVAFGSCYNPAYEGAGGLSSAFGRILTRNPDLFFHLGDWDYADQASTSQATHRADMELPLDTSSSLRNLLAVTPLTYKQGDHDAGALEFPGLWLASNRAAARQVFPYPTLPDTLGLYHSYVVGRVRFIFTDDYTFPDDDGSTKLGATQLAWFLSELEQPEPVKVWLSSSIWNEHDDYADADGPDDAWGFFDVERATIVDHIQNDMVGRLVILSGDSHGLFADDGTNTWCGSPTFSAAPFLQYGSVKTTNGAADWSEGGNWNSEDLSSRYGWLHVTDDGQTITLDMAGYNESDTAIITLEVEIDTAVPEGSASGTTAWTGAASGVAPELEQHTGTATGTTAWAGSATGARLSVGVSSGTTAWAGAAQGTRSPIGTSTGQTSWQGSASGVRSPVATATGETTWSGTATGQAPDVDMATGTATGSTAWTGAAQGQAPDVEMATGIAAGSTSWTGAAQGQAPDVDQATGSATGTTSWTGAATGQRTAVATANGSTTWAGVAVGRTTRTGTATGTVGWTGTATGHAPSVDGREGVATGETSWTGTAAGQRHPKADAAGAVQWTGSAHGTTTRAGTATGSLTWVGVAHGSGTGPSDARDITITLGPPTTRTLRVEHPTGRPFAIGSPRS